MRTLPVLLALALLLAACGSAQPADPSAAASAAASPGQPPGSTAAATDGDVVTITWESYNYGTEGIGGRGTQLLIDAFEASHPHIRIDPVGTPVGEIHVSVQAQAAAGNPPDVAQIGWSKFGFVQQNLPVVPLEEAASADELDAHLEGMLPAALELGRDPDGRLLGLPYTISTPTLFLNADLFTSAGLDPDDPPATWAEAQEDALAIAETGAQGIYIAAADPSKSDYLTQTLINSAGGRLLEEDGTLGLDGEPAATAMGMLADLTASGAQPAIDTTEALALFESGGLGMLVVSTAVFAGFATSTEGVFELDTAPLPAFGDQPVQPTNSGAGLFVFAEEGPQRDAAWELVEFLTSDEGFTIITEDIGYLPLRPGLVDAPDGLADYFAADDRLLASLDQLDDLVPYQVMPGQDGDRVREMIQDEAVAPIILSGADPVTTLADVDARAEDLLDG